MESPCRDCIRRQVGCHIKCVEYQEYRKRLSKKSKDYQYQMYIGQAVHRMKTKRGVMRI